MINSLCLLIVDFFYKSIYAGFSRLFSAESEISQFIGFIIQA